MKHTLVIRANKNIKKWLLNTNVSPELTDALINKIIDKYHPEDWWIDEGWDDSLLLNRLPLVEQLT